MHENERKSELRDGKKEGLAALKGLEGARENKASIYEDVAYIDLMQLNLAGEMVLIPSAEVAEVLRVQPLNTVPMAPDHLLGVCNVHGQVLCVIDPCRVMRLESTALKDGRSTHFVVLRHPVMNLALRVDGVSSLFNIQASRLDELEEEEALFFRGKITMEGHTYRVIDVEALFA